MTQWTLNANSFLTKSIDAGSNFPVSPYIEPFQTGLNGTNSQDGAFTNSGGSYQYYPIGYYQVSDKGGTSTSNRWTNVTFTSSIPATERVTSATLTAQYSANSNSVQIEILRWADWTPGQTFSDPLSRPHPLSIPQPWVAANYVVTSATTASGASTVNYSLGTNAVYPGMSNVSFTMYLAYLRNRNATNYTFGSTAAYVSALGGTYLVVNTTSSSTKLHQRDVFDWVSVADRAGATVGPATTVAVRSKAIATGSNTNQSTFGATFSYNYLSPAPQTGDVIVGFFTHQTLTGNGPTITGISGINNLGIKTYDFQSSVTPGFATLAMFSKAYSSSDTGFTFTLTANSNGTNTGNWHFVVFAISGSDVNNLPVSYSSNNAGPSIPDFWASRPAAATTPYWGYWARGYSNNESYARVPKYGGMVLSHAYGASNSNSLPSITTDPAVTNDVATNLANGWIYTGHWTSKEAGYVAAPQYATAQATGRKTIDGRSSHLFWSPNSNVESLINPYGNGGMVLTVVVPAKASVTTQTLSYQLTDSSAQSDSAKGSISATRQLTDSAASSDLLDRTAKFWRYVTDSAASADGLISGITMLRQLTDSAASSDLLVSSLKFTRQVSDVLSGADTTSINGLKTVNDSMSFAEIVKSTRAMLRTGTSDALSNTETVTNSVARSRLVSDSSACNETLITAKITVTRNVNDGLAFVDGLSRGATRTVTDQFTVTDLVSRGVNRPRATSDSVSFSEQTKTSLVSSRGLVDAVGLADAVAWTSPQNFTLAPTNSYLVAQRSLRAAAKRVRSNIEANMTATVLITRLTDPELDSHNFVSVNAGMTVYSGPARLTTAQGPVTFTLGEEVQFFSSAWATLPLDRNGTPYYPQVNDLLAVTGADDPAMVERRFRVVDVEATGMLATHRRIQLVGVQRYSGWSPSRTPHRSTESVGTIPPDWLA